MNVGDRGCFFFSIDIQLKRLAIVNNLSVLYNPFQNRGESIFTLILKRMKRYAAFLSRSEIFPVSTERAFYLLFFHCVSFYILNESLASKLSAKLLYKCVRGVILNPLLRYLFLRLFSSSQNVIHTLNFQVAIRFQVESVKSRLFVGLLILLLNI